MIVFFARCQVMCKNWARSQTIGFLAQRRRKQYTEYSSQRVFKLWCLLHWVRALEELKIHRVNGAQ